VFCHRSALRLPTSEPRQDKVANPTVKSEPEGHTTSPEKACLSYSMQPVAAKLAEVNENLETYRREFEAYRDKTERLIASLQGSLAARDLIVAEARTNQIALLGQLEEKELALSQTIAEGKFVEASVKAQLHDLELKLAAAEAIHREELLERQTAAVSLVCRRTSYCLQ
jgi:hypothetical protein